MVSFHSVSPTAAYLMVPYFGWTLYATGLTLAVYKLNPRVNKFPWHHACEPASAFCTRPKPIHRDLRTASLQHLIDQSLQLGVSRVVCTPFFTGSPGQQCCSLKAIDVPTSGWCSSFYAIRISSASECERLHI